MQKSYTLRNNMCARYDKTITCDSSGERLQLCQEEGGGEGPQRPSRQLSSRRLHDGFPLHKTPPAVDSSMNGVLACRNNVWKHM